MPLESNIPQVIASLEGYTSRLRGAALTALDKTGMEAIDYARSETAKMQPPAKKGEGPRPAHPGGWADISGITAASMKHVAEHLGTDRFALTLTAGGAAPYLERMHGYWVFSGMFEGWFQRVAAKNLKAAIEAHHK